MNLTKLLRNKIRSLQKNRLELTSLTVSSDNTVDYKFQIKGEWQKYFRTREKFSINYGIDVLDVPEGVLVIPFLATILPIAWLCNAEIVINEVDANFYKCIDKIKDGYKEMYPMLSFNGRITALAVNSYPQHLTHVENKSALFFSAGADSFDSLLAHKQERPLLITLWGSDISFEDTVGWRRIQQRIEETKKLFGCDSVVVKTNFRKILRYGELNKLVAISGDNWWHGFQHGIGILCHAAPYAYIYGFKTLYIASSLTEESKGKVTCASDPSIDEKTSFLNCNVVHDGYKFSRIQKIQHIVDFSRKTNIFLPLHVCWIEAGGENCSSCEKCIRTILEIYACGGDPRKYGFNPLLVSEKVVLDARSTYANWRYVYPEIFNNIQQRYTKDSIEDWAKWILNIKI